MHSNELIEHYEKYLFKDIDAMMLKADQKNDKGELGNQMAVPVTFSVFAALDVFGFLIRNTQTVVKLVEKELHDTCVNIAYSMLWSNFDFPDFDIQIVSNILPSKRAKDQQYIDFQKTALYKFIKIYRNGIMHTFFPKAFSISNCKANGGELHELFYRMDGILVFNVRKFHSNFQNFIAEFKNKLASDTNFNQRIEENIKWVFKADSPFDEFLMKIIEIHKFSYSFNSENNTTTFDTTKFPGI
jgi:hypothetical protein